MDKQEPQQIESKVREGRWPFLTLIATGAFVLAGVVLAVRDQIQSSSTTVARNSADTQQNSDQIRILSLDQDDAGQQSANEESANAGEANSTKSASRNAAAEPTIVVPLRSIDGPTVQSLLPGDLKVSQIDDALNAVCRVTSKPSGNMGGGFGSGVVFAEGRDDYFILTAASLVSGPEAMLDVEFFHAGYRSQPLQAAVAWTPDAGQRNGGMVVLRLPKDKLRNYPQPAIISLAEREYDVKEGELAVVAGWASTGWTIAWVGRISEVPSRRGFSFAPPPANASVGAAVLSADCTKVIGLTLRSDGTATSTNLILEEIAKSGKVLMLREGQFP